MENESDAVDQDLLERENKENCDLKQPELDEKESQNEKGTNDQDGKQNLILRVYNVPPEYTPSKLQEIIEESSPSAKISEILQPNPWDDRIDTCWILICKDVETYKSLLTLEDIWFKPDKNDKFAGAITFVSGDKLDLPHIPSKSDQQLLLDELLKNKSN